MVLCLLSLGTAHAEDSEIPQAIKEEIATYKKFRDFKAFAVCKSASDLPENWIRGFSYKFDTAQDSVDAALAYCRVSLGRFRNPSCKDCKIFLIGDIRVDDAGPGKIALIIRSYEEEVINDLKTRIENDNDREALTILETIYQKIGRYDESEALLYDLAMQGEHLAQNALGYHWAERNKRLDEALELVESAIQKNPHNFSYYDTKAMVLYRLGRLKEAIKALEKALTLTENPVMLDHLGDIYWLLDNKEKALKIWNRSIAASSNILFIERLRKKIKTGMTGDIVFE